MFLIKNVKYVMIFISLNFFLAILVNAQEENNIGDNNKQLNEEFIVIQPKKMISKDQDLDFPSDI
tara:strand:- start:516 stop:710 length:195 start_codon:yes stop_codon:yes gene_type:complete